MARIPFQVERKARCNVKVHSKVDSKVHSKVNVRVGVRTRLRQGAIERPPPLVVRCTPSGWLGLGFRSEVKVRLRV